MTKTNIRKAVSTDDMLKIAKVLYLADPYVYPPWFYYNDEFAYRCLAYLCRYSSFFSYENTILALDEEGNIAGLLLYINKNDNFNFEVFDDMWNAVGKEKSEYNDITIEGYVKEFIKFDSDYYILNLAVDEQYRRAGVGTSLLDYFDQSIKRGSITLEVVGENLSAISLYEKQGYVKIEEFPTFCVYNTKLTSYHMFKKI